MAFPTFPPTRPLTPWYHEGSANGISSPNGSCGAAVAGGATDEEDSDCGFGAGLGAGAGAGAGSAAFLVSSEPTSNWPLYFFRIPSLWYFQNCLEASLPATRWRTVQGSISNHSGCFKVVLGGSHDVLFFPPVRHHRQHVILQLPLTLPSHGTSARNTSSCKSETYQGAHLGTWRHRRRPHR